MSTTSCAIEYLGFNKPPVLGNKVRHRLPKKRWAGLVDIPSDGVFLQSSRARNSDLPASRHFPNSHLTVLTAFSAFPLILTEDIGMNMSHVRTSTALQTQQTLYSCYVFRRRHFHDGLNLVRINLKALWCGHMTNKGYLW